jgi:hypothetical protein
MIPTSHFIHFIHVIQAEREVELRRWQLAREATLSKRQRHTTSFADRVRAAFGTRSLASRPGMPYAPHTDRAASITPCC